MSVQEPPRTGGRGFRLATLALLIVTLALLLPLRQVDASVPMYGVEVAVWLVAIGFYTLGLAAGWVSMRARRG